MRMLNQAASLTDAQGLTSLAPLAKPQIIAMPPFTCRV